jgi:hypothetical protein
MGLGFNMYAQDYDEGVVSCWEYTPVGGWQRWYHKLEPYTKNWSLYVDPSDPNKRCVGYGVNLVGVRGSCCGSRTLASPVKPAETIIIFDTTQNCTCSGPWGWAGDWNGSRECRGHPRSVNPVTGATWNSHNSMWQAAFYDGHVKPYAFRREDRVGFNPADPYGMWDTN